MVNTLNGNVIVWYNNTNMCTTVHVMVNVKAQCHAHNALLV